jgi:four helix bundle protein
MADRREEMLRIYDTMIETLKMLRLVLPPIERFDADLARQLRRASASVALNLSEGSGSAGGNRTQRYRTALGSARESAACLDVAIAFGYVDEVDPELRSKLDRVIGGLVRLAT